MTPIRLLHVRMELGVGSAASKSVDTVSAWIILVLSAFQALKPILAQSSSAHKVVISLPTFAIVDFPLGPYVPSQRRYSPVLRGTSALRLPVTSSSSCHRRISLGVDHAACFTWLSLALTGCLIWTLQHPISFSAFGLGCGTHTTACRRFHVA